MSDPYIIFYTLGGLVLVFIAYVVFTLFTEGIRTINQRIVEEEKKKKEIENKKRAA